MQVEDARWLPGTRLWLNANGYHGTTLDRVQLNSSSSPPPDATLGALGVTPPTSRSRITP